MCLFAGNFHSKKLGKKDALFRLKKPPCPKGVNRELYEQWVPDELIIRAVKSRKKVIVTTMLDAEEYSCKDIIALYLERWHVELDFRCIKSVMKMDVLRCKTTEMVCKEIDIHLLVYNLIRVLMARSAKQLDSLPRTLSFKAAQETLQAFQVLLTQAEQSLLFKLSEYMVAIVSEHIVGNRPGRSEPRAVKRRPKPHRRLQHHRKQARRLRCYKG